MQTGSEWKAFEAIAAEARHRSPKVERLAYRAPGTMSVPARGDEPTIEAAVAPGAGEEPGQGAARLLEEQLREAEAEAGRRIEAAHRQGREELEAVRRRTQEQARATIEATGAQVAAALHSFHAEREAYFVKVEREVVRLALAIAARILHREAQLDPLLLAAAVRVALGQLRETTGVRLRCPEAQTGRWRQLLEGIESAPEVVGDADLEAGECVLEAEVGTVDLGVRAQLGEIERGFFDLLEHRPELRGAREAPPGNRPATEVAGP